MIEVIPAIIPQDFEDLKEHLASLKGIVSMVQIDICDGKFVPSKSWPYIGDGGELNSIINEDEGLPFWQDFDFEIDLMVSKPQDVVEKWIKAGARRIILHYESIPNLKEFLESLRQKYGYISDIPVSLEFGVAFGIKTSNDLIHQFLTTDSSGRSLADFVQFMGIRNIGYQGQNFDEEVLGKIRELRESHPDSTISIDGGVNFDSIRSIVDAGVNRVVSGSTIFESENIKAVIEEMRNI